MWHQMFRRKLFLFGLMAITLLVFAACAAGVPQSEYSALQAQMAELEQKSQAFQQQLSATLQEATSLQEQLAQKEQEAADLQAKLGEFADVTILLAAKGPLPPPEPPATPTPLPAGATPPPRPTTPAEYDEAVDFAFYVETLVTTRQSEFGYAATLSCVPSGVFKRGQRIVWRFEVFDITAGKRLIDRDEPTVTVVLPHGEELTARFSQRAGGRVPGAPWMWNAFWDIPLDYPLGGLDYRIVVTTKDERTGTFQQPALVSETTDSRVRIVE
ncbi:MAG: hypothetical protein H3C34_01470 [Caldilineaceae bacterium]|nr:hypothetical protein [Caldilineaceae bacterium]